jgi:hypothetical protein
MCVCVCVSRHIGKKCPPESDRLYRQDESVFLAGERSPGVSTCSRPWTGIGGKIVV